jgi:hypothetical protein
MFLVKDSSTSREKRIKQFLTEDPALASLLAVVHFEWTIRRAIIALGTSSNVKVREKLTRCHGCDRYKDIWKEEVSPKLEKRLPEVIQDWNGVVRAFRLRHRLVHGVSSCGADYAKERVYWALNAATDIRNVCASHSIDLDSRLPVRRCTKPEP